jgi:hypothetical protein
VFVAKVLAPDGWFLGRIAIGYVLNQMGSELVGDPRGKGLADAVYAALG